jgi:hypothetical protein
MIAKASLVAGRQAPLRRAYLEDPQSALNREMGRNQSRRRR